MGDASTTAIGGSHSESRPECGLARAPALPDATLQPSLRHAIAVAYLRPEEACLPELIEQACSSPASRLAAHELATRLVVALRAKSATSCRQSLVPSLLQAYPLSGPESIALMCLAEALLRIPDTATQDALIRDKLARGDWRVHARHSKALLADAAAWGLHIAGKLTGWNAQAEAKHTVSRLMSRGFAPLARSGAAMAMRLISDQFVAGESIAQALMHARRYEAMGFRYSYDMLGEAAMTAADAERYFAAYASAIHAIGRAAAAGGPIEGPGISVKLSALHPRYGRAQRERVMRELFPRLRSLALLARRYDIGIDIDAEEANRLDLSLDIVAALCGDGELAGWSGIGLAVQAYQKRAPQVIDWLIDLARRGRRRIMVRLVKGAYWDSEIKRAQVEGLAGYPCFTRKVYTDVCYLACARKLLAAPDAIYPQFATHNAHTLAAIYCMADTPRDRGQYEFQCLHGMGEPLYEQVVGPSAAGGLGIPCRIYAPVGRHRTLLPYLVRRLLESGANTSFVHRLADRNQPVNDLVADPVVIARAITPPGAPHPGIPLPVALYGDARPNSMGIDLSDELELGALSNALREDAAYRWLAQPMLGAQRPSKGRRIDIRNPADREDRVGQVIEATHQDVLAALDCAVEVQPVWTATPATERAAILRRAADLIDTNKYRLIALAVREAGKTLPNAIAEVREAIDYLRYYASQIQLNLARGSQRPRGPVACISPWNFPLAIFAGQVSAALAAGNTVVAKPAEQTPLMAAQAVRLFHQAGVPASALQLLPGRGETIGAALIGDERVQAVMFTGSTEVAKSIQCRLAERLDACGEPVAFIAETGGQNAMIVDSSALAEQAVADVLQSAFDSAGQRCSSLRLLCLQEEIADRIQPMLKDAMRELAVGRPDKLSTDIGPLIDAQARAAVLQHVERMRSGNRAMFQVPLPPTVEEGTFFAPTLIQIDSVDELEREVFGPVLHVLRYRRDRLDALLEAIAATGYGLTLGIQTRIEETIEHVLARVQVGNIYVNRNTIGAVVGVQPFGGEGLSGTGPKAGGPLYLTRLLRGHAMSSIPQGLRDERVLQPAAAYRDWLVSRGFTTVADLARRYLEITPCAISTDLPGPAGEQNTYCVNARGLILCHADTEQRLLEQLAAVFASGNRALLADGEPARNLHATLPQIIRSRIVLARDWTEARFQHALFAGERAQLQELCRRIAARPGPIIGLQARGSDPLPYALEPLLVERSLCVNTAAAGGNASLMTIA